MNNYQSIATINAPEFINLQPLDINPLMSKCEIKVLYLGKNRNGTSISRAAAIDMAKTLRGAPIVGYYKKDKGDFFDHGEQVIYDGEGVHFNTLTKPYGFVAPDAKVWFQDFEETADNGESSPKTYLMTTGYLWTGQYQEAQQVLDDGGKPHSMELDKNSMNGFWAKEENSDMEFFIINDAVFSKLCILGDDVEPCFEGSSITAPNVSSNFTLDDDFRKSLSQMMKELQYALQGGNNTVGEDVKKKSVDSSEVIEETQVVETPDVTPTEPETPVEENSNTAEPSGDANATDVAAPAEEAAPAEGNDASDGADAGSEGGDGSDGSGSSDYVKSDDDKKESDDEEEDKADDKKEEDDKKEDKYSLLVVELEELKASYAALQETMKQTTAELERYTNQEKDALIEEFYMLSDEDKKDVIEHKTEYSLADIKAKLAILCYDKKVIYNKEDSNTPEGMTVDVPDTYSNQPEWLQAVEKHKQK
jgi:hypothetical protein